MRRSGIAVSSSLSLVREGEAHGENRPERASPSKRHATREAILRVAAGSPGVTAGDVAKATGIPRNTVAGSLTRLRKAGALEKRERGYAVASKWGWHEDQPEAMR